jgi:hypothetical protein
MKCDEMKPLKNIEIAFNTTSQQEQVIAEDSEGNCYGFDSWEEVYLKDEVDAAIAELKAENTELKQKLESVQATAYAESADAAIRELKLKRALYKACANWAHFAVAFFSSYATKERWHNMEIKCLKKAKEYR